VTTKRRNQLRAKYRAKFKARLLKYGLNHARHGIGQTKKSWSAEMFKPKDTPDAIRDRLVQQNKWSEVEQMGPVVRESPIAKAAREWSRLGGAKRVRN